MTTTDPVTIKSWAEAASAVMNAIRTIIASLPSGKKREEAERLLAEAEREHKNAEAASAVKLGFELCEYCWPAEIILLSPETKRLQCRHCRRAPLRIEQEERLAEIDRRKQLNYNA